MDDHHYMRLALQLARRGEGHVEPNPMVGCGLVREGQIVGQGWHRRFGGPHAEVEALKVAGDLARGATAFVTLEPCCHQGKTPPCTKALLDAGVQRVVVAQHDPFRNVAGRGIQMLREQGVHVDVGLLEPEAHDLNAPYRHLLHTGRPWVIAKWAMTLDGKLAARGGHSQWISNPSSRQRAHQLRGRVDAILIGRGTLEHDDPLLTARPPGPRVAVRIVLDSKGRFSSSCLLAKTASEAPVLIAVASDCPPENRHRIEQTGAEVFVCEGTTHEERLRALLTELGNRRLTNLLVEGGSHLLGVFRDANLINEVHVFLAPRVVGGAEAKSPCGGKGVVRIEEGWRLKEMHHEALHGDLHLWGRVDQEAAGEAFRNRTPKAD